MTFGAYGTPNLPNSIPAASLNFLGPISDLTGGGNPTLNKIGFGDVIFSGANVYGGQTVVQEGRSSSITLMPWAATLTAPR